MLQSGKQASKQSLEWLDFEQGRLSWRYKDENYVIKHAFNYGEQIVAGYHVDGFVSIPCAPSEDDSDESDGESQGSFTVAYEFLGCRWHFCPWKCCETDKTIEDGVEDQKRLYAIGQAVDKLIVKRGCEWERERADFLDAYESDNFCFLREKNITEEIILDWIKDDKFYGMIRADVHTPPEVIEEYEHLNFPFIFQKFNVTEDMLSKTMLSLAKENGKKFPSETRTLTWNATDIILTTTMVQFYNQIGMKVSNIRWAVQYVPSKPFTQFVDGMVDVRIQAKKTDNKPLGERAKFCLNSCVGRFGMNLSKHRATNYVSSKDKLRAIRSPLVESYRSISSEYRTSLHEVIQKKRRQRDTIPVHCRHGL